MTGSAMSAKKEQLGGSEKNSNHALSTIVLQSISMMINAVWRGDQFGSPSLRILGDVEKIPNSERDGGKSGSGATNHSSSFHCGSS